MTSQGGTATKRLLVRVGLLAAIITVGSAASANAGSAIPMKARDAGSATVVGANGSVIHTSDTGSGEATHLGRFTLVAGEDIDLATGAITNGFFTFTGANGDTVSGTYSGQALPGFTGYVVSGPITGGSGRFAGATGFLLWNGTLDPAVLSFTDEITGTISSVGDLK
jgi:hypothetical protein